MPAPLRLFRCITLACSALLLAGLGATAAPNAPVATSSAALAADPLAQAVLAAVNRYRLQRGLASWQPDPGLEAIAAGHSRAQATQGRLDHAGFAQRFARSGGLSCAENLAAGYRDGEAVVAAWQASPTHRDNLLAPDLQRVGLASDGGFVTLLACRFQRH